jgi:hypothetical protein
MPTKIGHPLPCASMNRQNPQQFFSSMKFLLRSSSQQIFKRFLSVKNYDCAKMVNKYTTVERGAPNSTNYRVFFRKY